MMLSKNRLHIYPHKEPNGTAYIVGESRGLKDLARKLEQAANGAVGLETLTLYGSDGHPYQMIIVCDVSEDEWQNLTPGKYPTDLETIKVYQSFRSDMS